MGGGEGDEGSLPPPKCNPGLGILCDRPRGKGP